MKKTLAHFVIIVLTIVFSGLYSYPEELPKPTYDNSIIFSITHNFLTENASEIQYIKSQFGSGLYAPLMFSNFYEVGLDWHTDINNIGNGLDTFKAQVDELISFAEEHKVGIHLTINYGISRRVTYYNDAKEEDIRNAQWYNDNNISSQAQMSSVSGVTSAAPAAGTLDLNHVDMDARAMDIGRSMADSSVLNSYVFTTMSRYARKLRAHLEAKVRAAYDYLKQQQDAHSDIIIVVSAPGESELNYNRLDNGQSLQDYFCDYSPFAVLEFRDWIKHEGLYAEGEAYAGEGYVYGGTPYQGAGGLSNFNTDFGTSFTTWDLKYYNWSLSDPVDTVYTDTANPDPNIIPLTQYTYNNMMPTSGSQYIAGGFDPPRVMSESGTSAFYDLWHTFRETLVYHYVRDMTGIAGDSGFPKKQYYTHQIPGDYLFGTRPDDPAIPQLNPRYYASASPMWTADVYPDNGMGITLYDIKYSSWFARTSRYAIDGAGSMSENWAALEYNPEVIPQGVNATLSTVSYLYDQIMRIYTGNVHVISFFKWKDSSENTSVYRYKGNNRGTALKQFFDAVKDKARQPVTTVFTPKEVESFSGSYNSNTGLVNLSWSSKIWTDLTHTWSDWGDFKEFAIYRGYTQDFTANGSSEIARKTAYSYSDIGFAYDTTVYYKIAAVNSKGEAGPTRTVSVVTPAGMPIPILAVSRDRLNFGYILGGASSPSQEFRISNSGAGALTWTATADAAWLSCSPSSGTGNAVVTVSVDPSGLSAGTYLATITVSDPHANDSPQTIAVNLTVKASNQEEPPFGSFDTPLDESIARSSIAVTGWVLDDLGVESVKIYREPESGGSPLVYIGDASFVEGARPDIENTYPEFPGSYKAGWGYMMLTNFLPNKGNGTFTLHAVATDTSGNQVTLGTKTIICDNANAVKPFGAIDTPGQGGGASGSGFINWGWVLTPMPNSIPTDGSTINVYIDGVNIGHPAYNIYRSDIANAFPGYANSDGAIGYFVLDTTSYNDGIHTIAWTAMDSAGHTDGIGSRYFTVQNSGAEDTATSRQTAVSNHKIPNIPIDYSAHVKVKKGYDRDNRFKLETSGLNGVITFTVKQNDRLEIHLDRSGNTKFHRAYQVVGNRGRALPIGSTFDPQKGVFYWQVGPGFLGTFTFDFVVKKEIRNKTKMKRQRINVKIQHK